MNHFILSGLAFLGGVLLTVQGGLNAQLGVLLKSPLLASVIAFFSSTFFALIIALLFVKNLPGLVQIKAIPLYYWFAGGFFSVAGISLYYYTIPKLGVSTMISFGLCGQLIFAVVAGHFGWFSMPIEPLTIKRTLGVLAMITGILLINLK